MSSENKKKFIQSVGRALGILEQLSTYENGARLVDISKDMELNKSTVHSLMSTLEQMNYVQQDGDTGRYALGIKIFELGKIYERQMNLVKIAQPYLEALGQKCSETVHMAVESSGEIVYVSKVDSPYALTMTSQVGGRNFMHCTGVGKVLLAYMEPAAVEAIIEEKGLKKITDNTISNKKDLFEALEKIRATGHGSDLEEIEVGLNCIAVPVRNHSGKVIAAISISAPVGRMTSDQVLDLETEILKTASDISKALGYVN